MTTLSPLVDTNPLVHTCALQHINADILTSMILITPDGIKVSDCMLVVFVIMNELYTEYGHALHDAYLLIVISIVPEEEDFVMSP